MDSNLNLNQTDITNNLNEKGFAIVKNVLSRIQCNEMCELYQDDSLFRNTVNMQQYRFGLGEYKYFNYPLPPPIQSLRETFYELLAVVANEWMTKLQLPIQYSTQHDDFLKTCLVKGQSRPTPLMLKYKEGGFNTLHQDMYGEVFFPFQVVLTLTQRGFDHEGGEFVLTEQIPRSQSRVHVLQPAQGDAVIFTTSFRPVKGSKAYYRANVKHGVSQIQNGVRYALGIIFHDAR